MVEPRTRSIVPEPDETIAPVVFVYLFAVLAWLFATIAWVFWFRGYA